MVKWAHSVYCNCAVSAPETAEPITVKVSRKKSSRGSRGAEGVQSTRLRPSEILQVYLLIMCVKVKIDVLGEKCTGNFLRARPVLRGGHAQSLGGRSLLYTLLSLSLNFYEGTPSP